LTVELVIVPAWRRPDWLYATLSRLAVAGDGQQTYWIMMDRGCDPQAGSVAYRWQSSMQAMVRVVHRPNHPYPGNSFNVLEAYREACSTDADLIFLVEEDVFVGADFFTAHRAAHTLLPDVFAVSACRNQFFPIGAGPPADDAAVYRHASYQSLAVSFRPDRLRAVTGHMVHGYYSDQIGYCRSTFPKATIPPPNAEQDGLIGRVVEQHRWTTAYMASPRAYHAGFIGYNRAGRALAGTVEQRAGRLLAMTADQLNAHARSYRDHVTTDLDAPRAPVSRVADWP
jgi:hypothetical protein